MPNRPQQRRRNAPTARSAFPVFPQVFFNYLITATGAATITVTNPWGISAPEIPDLLRNDTDLPISMAQPNVNTLELTYATPIGVDDVIAVPNWCQNLRGLNGEYFAPRQWRVNSNQCTTGVIYTLNVVATGGSGMTVSFSEDVSILSLPPWTLDDGNTVVSAAAGFAPDQIDLVMLNPTASYSNYLMIGEGDSSVQGVSGRFVAPCFNFMT